MSEIVPTLLAESLDEYKAQVEQLFPFAKHVHIDVSDGEFTPTFLVSATQVWWPDTWTVDIHAMVARPGEQLQALINLKPRLIVFHAETQNLMPVLEAVKKTGIRAGVALLRSTVPETVAELIKAADHVMIFSGDLGKDGGAASMMQLEKIRLIKEINPEAEIGWDGGVAVDNAYSLAQGGVDLLNVGSAIRAADDPKAAYDTLVQEINKHGVI